MKRDEDEPYFCGAAPPIPPWPKLSGHRAFGHGANSTEGDTASFRSWVSCEAELLKSFGNVRAQWPNDPAPC